MSETNRAIASHDFFHGFPRTTNVPAECPVSRYIAPLRVQSD